MKEKTWKHLFTPCMWLPAMLQPLSPRGAKADTAKALLDVGGRHGHLCRSILASVSRNARGTVFDRAPVIKMAKERLADSDVKDRIAFASGDFYAGPLPGGHDLVLLSAIIHQNSQEQNIALYKKCFDALVPGGRILIRDHVLTPDRTRPVGGAVFAVNMLAATEGGNCLYPCGNTDGITYRRL